MSTANQLKPPYIGKVSRLLSEQTSDLSESASWKQAGCAVAVVAAGRNRLVRYTYDEHFTRRGRGRLGWKLRGQEVHLGGCICPFWVRVFSLEMLCRKEGPAR